MQKFFKKNIPYGKITDEIIIQWMDDELNIMVSTHVKKSAGADEGYQSASILLKAAMVEELKKFLTEKK